MCGFEEMTHGPDPLEFRPTPPLQLKTTPSYQGVGGGSGGVLTIGDQALLGGMLINDN